MGDYVQFEMQGDMLGIKPVKVIQPGQEYFYAREWQEKEGEADRDITQGRVSGPFATIGEALKALKAE